MVKMRDPKTEKELDVAEASVKDFSHIGWVIVPTEEPKAEKKKEEAEEDKKEDKEKEKK